MSLFLITTIEKIDLKPYEKFLLKPIIFKHTYVGVKLVLN